MLAHAEKPEKQAQITHKIGLLPNRAPHFEDLHRFGGHLTGEKYIAECERETGELDAVSIMNGYEESVTRTL